MSIELGVRFYAKGDVPILGTSPYILYKGELDVSDVPGVEIGLA